MVAVPRAVDENDVGTEAAEPEQVLEENPGMASVLRLWSHRAAGDDCPKHDQRRPARVTGRYSDGGGSTSPVSDRFSPQWSAGGRL